MSTMRVVIGWFLVAGALVAVVILGAEAAALYFGRQRVEVFVDASYEPLSQLRGSTPTGACSTDLTLDFGPWWQRLALPWWAYPVTGGATGALLGLVCSAFGVRMTRPGQR